MNHPADASKQQLRKQLRQLRRKLSAQAQITASQSVWQQLSQQEFFQHASTIAFYCAADGELDPALIMQESFNRGKACCLPVLSPHMPNHVSFAPYQQGDTLIPNQWNILEPDCAVDGFISPMLLDIVFVPVVGFDQYCNRMGMGKGFYDRTFSYRKSASNGPVLVGLAHECQKVDEIPMAEWDVKLDRLITGSGGYFAPAET